jgi:hypothetical protein
VRPGAFGIHCIRNGIGPGRHSRKSALHRGPSKKSHGKWCGILDTLRDIRTMAAWQQRQNRRRRCDGGLGFARRSVTSHRSIGRHARSLRRRWRYHMHTYDRQSSPLLDRINRCACSGGVKVTGVLVASILPGGLCLTVALSIAAQRYRGEASGASTSRGVDAAAAARRLRFPSGCRHYYASGAAPRERPREVPPGLRPR